MPAAPGPSGNLPLAGSAAARQYLELVDASQVVTWAIALLALVVSVATYRLNVRDKRYAWEAHEQAQAVKGH